MPETEILVISYSRI